MSLFGLSNEDCSVDEQLYQMQSTADHFVIQYKHLFYDDMPLLFVHNLFYCQGEKFRFSRLHEEYTLISLIEIELILPFSILYERDMYPDKIWEPYIVHTDN
jgi:hypothetical protein